MGSTRWLLKGWTPSARSPEGNKWLSCSAEGGEDGGKGTSLIRRHLKVNLCTDEIMVTPEATLVAVMLLVIINSVINFSLSVSDAGR